MSHLIGMQIPAKLKYVKIFFDTPTFDKITKDKSAKVSEVNILQIQWPHAKIMHHIFACNQDF